MIESGAICFTNLNVETYKKAEDAGQPVPKKKSKE